LAPLGNYLVSGRSIGRRRGKPTPPSVRSDQLTTGARSAAQNVRDSRYYESAVHANANFRAAREQKECGPIDDPKIHAHYIATFDK